MKKQLIIIGTGGLSKQISYLINNNKIKNYSKNSIQSFITFNKEERFFFKKKCKYFYDIKNFSKKNVYFIAIHDIFFRKKISNILIKKKLKLINIISKYSIVNTKKIGIGNMMLCNSIIHNDTEVLNFNFFFNFCSIAHDNSIGSYNNFLGFSSSSGYNKINNLNLFCSGSKINPKIKIGSKCVIFENKIVKKNMKSYEIKK